MLSYCLKCKTVSESKNAQVTKTCHGRIMLVSNCPMTNSEKRVDCWLDLIRNPNSFELENIIGWYLVPKM